MFICGEISKPVRIEIQISAFNKQTAYDSKPDSVGDRISD